MTKRRTRGDGGLYQRHDHSTCPPIIDGERAPHKCRGRWVGTVDVTIDGRPRRKYVYGRTSTEARRKLSEALREKDAGTIVVASMNTGAWLDYWLDNIAARKLRPQTLRGYRSKVNTYIKPTIGSHRLTSLRPEHIRHLHDKMRADGLAEASVRQAHAILKRALRVAVQEGKLGVSPADRMESPGTETNKREQFTVDQARRVLASTDDARWWLALFYGLRQGEALGLDWTDIDFERHLLRIRQTLQTNEAGELIFGPPKSKASARVIPLIPKMEARLRMLWEHQGRPTSGLLFTHHNGEPVHPRRDWQAWRDLIDRATTPPLAPLPQIALHAARNTAASMFEANKAQDRLVSQILGHGQVQITHGYQSADIARMAEEFTSLDRFLELE